MGEKEELQAGTTATIKLARGCWSLMSRRSSCDPGALRFVAECDEICGTISDCDCDCDQIGWLTSFVNKGIEEDDEEEKEARKNDDGRLSEDVDSADTLRAK